LVKEIHFRSGQDWIREFQGVFQDLHLMDSLTEADSQ